MPPVPVAPLPGLGAAPPVGAYSDSPMGAFLPLLLFGGRARRRNRTGSHDATTGYDPYACAATCSSQMGMCPPIEGTAFLELMEPAAPTPAILAPLPYAAMWPQGSGFQGFESMLPFLYMSNSRRASGARLSGVFEGPPLLMGCIATCQDNGGCGLPTDAEKTAAPLAQALKGPPVKKPQGPPAHEPKTNEPKTLGSEFDDMTSNSKPAPA